jgi:hypothetical protein
MGLGAGQAWAVPVGMGADGAGQLTTTIDCSPDLCEVGKDAAVEVSADPSAPNWLKTFKFQDDVPFGDDVIVTEALKVGQGQRWTDWHEMIVGDGWKWVVEGKLTAGGTDYDGTIDEQKIDFSGFDLAPGTEVSIKKEFECIAANGCGKEVQVREWPTVAANGAAPEPGAILLVAAGVAALRIGRIRRG